MGPKGQSKTAARDLRYIIIFYLFHIGFYAGIANILRSRARLVLFGSVDAVNEKRTDIS